MGAEAGWPLVSIVTAAYNMEALVEETIRSVLEQDYPNLEYIVLDDGSKDRTRDVIARYADRARIKTHPNMGETRTVNRGFELARGEIVGVVSADDPLMPGAIRKIVGVLQARPEVVVAYPDWLMIDGEGKILKEIQTFDYNYVDMVRWHHCVPGPGALFRRSVVTALHGSGNLAAHLLTLRQGLIALPDAKIIGPQLFEGLKDTLNVLIDAAGETPPAGLDRLRKYLESVCASQPDTIHAARKIIDTLTASVLEIFKNLEDKIQHEDWRISAREISFIANECIALFDHYKNLPDQKKLQDFSLFKMLLFYLLEKGQCEIAEKIYRFGLCSLPPEKIIDDPTC